MMRNSNPIFMYPFERYVIMASTRAKTPPSTRHIVATQRSKVLMKKIALHHGYRSIGNGIEIALANYAPPLASNINEFLRDAVSYAPVMSKMCKMSLTLFEPSPEFYGLVDKLMLRFETLVAETGISFTIPKSATFAIFVAVEQEARRCGIECELSEWDFFNK